LDGLRHEERELAGSAWLRHHAVSSAIDDQLLMEETIDEAVAKILAKLPRRS
jgi:hypothetical protein